jgi:type I restriction enzyme S subunit
VSELAWTDEVPSRYRVVRLGSVTREVRTRNVGMMADNLLSLSFGEIVTKDITSSDGLLPESFETYNIIKRGDIVLRLTDLQNDKRSLRSGLAREDGIITSAYTSVRPLAVEARFLAYQLRAIDLAKTFYSLGGGLRQSLSFDDIKTLRVAVPPGDEQRQIADYLDHETAEIDAFIADLAASVNLVQERISAELESLIWVAESDGVQLRRYVKEVDQGVSPIADNNPAGPGEAGVLKAGCTNDGRFAVDSNKRLLSDEDVPASAFVSPGDLIVTRASGSVRHVGSAAIVPLLDRRLAMSDKHYRLRFNGRASAEFIQLAMQTRRFRADLEPRISGAAGLAKNVSIAQLLSARVPDLPLATQRESGARAKVEVAALSEALADIDAAIALAKERRAALITAAVTGQIDVTTKQTPVVDSIQSAIEEAR